MRFGGDRKGSGIWCVLSGVTVLERTPVFGGVCVLSTVVVCSATDVSVVWTISESPSCFRGDPGVKFYAFVYFREPPTLAASSRSAAIGTRA